MATLSVQRTTITARIQTILGVDHSSAGWIDLSATGATGIGDIEAPPQLPYVAIVPRETSAEPGPPLNSYTYTQRIELRGFVAGTADSVTARLITADRLIYDCYRAIQEDFASDQGVGSLFRLLRTLEFGPFEQVGVNRHLPGRPAEAVGEVTVTYLLDAGL